MELRNYGKCLLIGICAAASPAILPPAAPAQSVCVVRGGDYPEFRQTAQGFWKGIAEEKTARAGGEKEYLLLPENQQGVLETIRGQSPRLIFVIGTEAVLIVRQAFPGTPLVFGMVFDPVRFHILEDPQNPPPGLSGAMANVPIETQWKTLRAIFPDVRNVGLLYSRSGVAAFEAVKTVLSADGVDMEAQIVGEGDDVRPALEQMGPLNLFWVLPDRIAFSARNRQEVFAFLRKQDIPIYVPSPKFMQGTDGADVAIAVDPEQNGRQAAEIALRYLRNGPIVIPAQVPRAWSVYVKSGRGISPSVGNVVYVE